jgi:hypothetical protein
MFAAHAHIFDARREVEKLESDLKRTERELGLRIYNTVSPQYKTWVESKKKLEGRLAKTRNDIALTQLDLDRLALEFGRRIDAGLNSIKECSEGLIKANKAVVSEKKTVVSENNAVVSENNAYKEKIDALEKRLQQLEDQSLQGTFGANQILQIDGFIKKQVHALAASKITQLVEAQRDAIADAVLQSPQADAHIKKAAGDEVTSVLQAMRPAVQADVAKDVAKVARIKVESDLGATVEKEIRTRVQEEFKVDTLNELFNSYTNQAIQKASAGTKKAWDETVHKTKSNLSDGVISAVEERLKTEFETMLKPVTQDMTKKLEEQLRNALTSETRDATAKLQRELDEAASKAKEKLDEVASKAKEKLDEAASKAKDKLEPELRATLASDAEGIKRSLEEWRVAREQDLPSSQSIGPEYKAEMLQEITDALLSIIGTDSTELRTAIETAARHKVERLWPFLSDDLRAAVEADRQSLVSSEIHTLMDECLERFHEAASSTQQRDSGFESFKVRPMPRARSPLTKQASVQHQLGQHTGAVDLQHEGFTSSLRGQGERLDTLSEAIARVDGRLSLLPQESSAVLDKHAAHLTALESAYDSLALSFGKIGSGTQQQLEAVTRRIDEVVQMLGAHKQEVRKIMMDGHAAVERVARVTELKADTLNALVRGLEVRVSNLTSEELFDAVTVVLRREYPIVEFKTVMDSMSRWKGGLKKQIEETMKELGMGQAEMPTLQRQVSRLENSTEHVSRLLAGLHRLLREAIEAGDGVDARSMLPRLELVFDGVVAELGRLVAYEVPHSVAESR